MSVTTPNPPPITSTPSFGNESSSSKSKKKSGKKANAGGESTEDDRSVKAEVVSEGALGGGGDKGGSAAGGEDDSEKEKYAGGGVGGVVLSKRMKKLRKLIDRSSAYVDIEVANLNKDQVAALAKLEHQKHTFAELEELKKQIDVAELEQAGNVRAQKKAEDDSREQSSSNSSSIPTFVSFLRIYSILFPNASGFSIQSSMPASLKDLTGQESASFGKTGHEIVVEGKVEVAQKLLSGSEEEVLEGVTYARLAQIISNFGPPSSSSTESASSSAKPTTNGVASELASVLPTLKFGSTEASSSNNDESSSSPAPETTSTPAASSFVPAPIVNAASAVKSMVFGSFSKEESQSVVERNMEKPASSKKAEAGESKLEKEEDEGKKEQVVEEKKETSKPKIEEPKVVIDKRDEPVGPKGMEGEGEGLDVAEEFDMGDPMEDREEREAGSEDEDEDDKVEESRRRESVPSTLTAPLSSSIPSISIAAPVKRPAPAPVNWADDDDEFGGGLPPIPSFGERGKYIPSSSPINASSFGKGSPLAGAAAPAPPVSKWGQTAFKSNLTKASVNAKPFSPASKPAPLAGAPAAGSSTGPRPNVYVPPAFSDNPPVSREAKQAQARELLRENRPSGGAPAIDDDGFVVAGSGRNKKPHSGGGGGNGRGGRGVRGGRGRGGRGGPRGGGAAPAAI